MKLSGVLTSIVIGIVLASHANAQQEEKCRSEMKLMDSFPKRAFDFVIAYNISSTKNAQSCVDLLERVLGGTKEDFTLAYTEGGVKYQRIGVHEFSNNRGSAWYKDNPSEMMYHYLEATPSGVYINYMCKGDDKFTWVFYENTKDLSKEADEVAKGLTANPADYKIGRDGC